MTISADSSPNLLHATNYKEKQKSNASSDHGYAIDVDKNAAPAREIRVPTKQLRKKLAMWNRLKEAFATDLPVLR